MNKALSRKAARLSKHKLFYLLTIIYMVILLLISSLACYSDYHSRKNELLTQIEVLMAGITQHHRGTLSNFWQIYMPIFEQRSNLYNTLANYFVYSTTRDLTPFEKSDLSSALSQMLIRDNQVKWVALFSPNRAKNYILFNDVRTLWELSDGFPYLDRLKSRTKASGMEVYGMEPLTEYSMQGSTFAICGGVPSNMGQGAIIAGYSTSYLAQIFKGYTLPIKSAQFDLLSGDEIVFCSDNRYNKRLAYRLSDIPAIPYEGMIDGISGQKLYMSVRASGNNTSNLVCTASWWEIFRYANAYTPWIFLIVLLFALFSVLIYTMILKIINKEVNTIRKGLNLIGENNLDHRIPVNFSQSGLPEIAESINHMALRLNDNINRAYYYELRQKDAEMSELQAKFNPHFLYNTFEMLRARSLQNGDEATAELITQLAGIFRGFIGAQTFVPLKEELTFSKRYLALFSARYGDQMRVQYDVDTELLKYGIIRNVFQPLIENYFIHGFDSSEEDNYILFRIKSLNDTAMIITVEDNGSGMSDEDMAKLNDVLQEPVRIDTESYGLKNLHQRLHLFYGGNCGLKVLRHGEKGLCIQITVLKMTCEDYAQVKKNILQGRRSEVMEKDE